MVEITDNASSVRLSSDLHEICSVKVRAFPHTSLSNGFGFVFIKKFEVRILSLLDINVSIRKMKFTVAVLCLGSAAGFTASSFSGSALKATPNDSTMLMATGMGVNGFGRIGRLGTSKSTTFCRA